MAIFDRAFDVRSLRLSNNSLKKISAPGIDGEPAKAWDKNTASTAKKLSELAVEIANQSYTPKQPIFIEIQKELGERQIGILCHRDKIVDRSLCTALTDQFENRFRSTSFAYRRKTNGRHEACGIVSKNIIDGEKRFVVYADIKNCFGAIPRRNLHNHIRELIQDQRLLDLIYKFTNLYGGRTGILQGSCTSPFFSNLYLHQIDVQMSDLGSDYLRYADDIVVTCNSALSASKTLSRLENSLDAIGLQLGSKSRISFLNSGEYVTFLGYEFKKCGISVCRKKLANVFKSLKEKIFEFDPNKNIFVDGVRSQDGFGSQLIERSHHAQVFENWKSQFPLADQTPIRAIERRLRKISKHNNVLWERFDEYRPIS